MVRSPWVLLSPALALAACSTELTSQSFGEPGEAQMLTTEVAAGDTIEFWNDIHIERRGDGAPSIFWEIEPSLDGKPLPPLRCNPYQSNYCTTTSDGAKGKRLSNCFIEGCELDVAESGELTVSARISGNGSGGKFVVSHTLRIKRE